MDAVSAIEYIPSACFETIGATFHSVWRSISVNALDGGFAGRSPQGTPQ
jgi:hypothetical protein